MESAVLLVDMTNNVENLVQHLKIDTIDFFDQFTYETLNVNEVISCERLLCEEKNTNGIKRVTSMMSMIMIMFLMSYLK